MVGRIKLQKRKRKNLNAQRRKKVVKAKQSLQIIDNESLNEPAPKQREFVVMDFFY